MKAPQLIGRAIIMADLTDSRILKREYQTLEVKCDEFIKYIRISTAHVYNMQRCDCFCTLVTNS